MTQGKRILITGCAGYLARRLLEACKGDPEIDWLGGIDIRPPEFENGIEFHKLDIRSPDLTDLLRRKNVRTVVHLAWVFNPTHNPRLEYEVDVLGSRNVLDAAKQAGVPYLIYLSSTTAYGPHADNPPVFNEEYPRRGHPGYLYSKYKAEVDDIMVKFREEHPELRMFVIRAPIILGPNTRNIVTQMTEMPVMVGVRGYDPPMQFLHEEDLRELLKWAIGKEPEGVYNVCGHGTIRFSKIVACLQKSAIYLPSWMLYPKLGLLWKLRLMPFPPSILDFIRYPWVASSARFESTFDFRVSYSSRDAFLAYANARK